MNVMLTNFLLLSRLKLRTLLISFVLAQFLLILHVIHIAVRMTDFPTMDITTAEVADANNL